MFSNFHTHTVFCDGADSPEELVLEALRLGCPEIGFSGRSAACRSGTPAASAFCWALSRISFPK